MLTDSDSSGLSSDGDSDGEQQEILVLSKILRGSQVLQLLIVSCRGYPEEEGDRTHQEEVTGQ